MSLMCHVVAGYPSEKDCIDLMLGMQATGVEVIEVQIPFSDPIADGETIMRANDRALVNGMTIKKSLDLIGQAKKQGLNVDVYVMTYFQKIFFYGIDKFCHQAAKAGAKGMIVPDLPYDAPEYKDFINKAKANGLGNIPVVSPAMADNRLQNQIKNIDGIVYLTSTKGITGKKLKTSEELAKTAEKIKKIQPNSNLAIGFGIENKADAKEILKIADITVVGSAVIRAINKDGVDAALKFVQSLL